MYFLSVFIFAVCLYGFWFLNFVGLPGNWLIVLSSAIFAFVYPAEEGQGMGWTTVGILIGLAFLAEVVEFISSSFGVAKGGSKRGALLAMLGSIIGGVLGGVIGSPLFLVGPLFGMLIFSCLGAWLGAFAGEAWKGHHYDHAVTIGNTAFVGRLVGALSKLVIGTIMVALAIISCFIS